ncbi:hypothetical protein NUU61_003280 [Penicillium alfredii]|uniref:Metallo-beta-lactamase domain-containing protein n=1 Tax=Penicillium alfredii TaxID=1506179 RepID=A0A9W9FT87_9EURO|nr:uncharacterized protein NUU61_003280 [Penicillium alfredii]KAJ5105933.1 hypothetical protein NUU61_003280 [Penicillium alfredii]
MRRFVQRSPRLWRTNNWCASSSVRNMSTTTSTVLYALTVAPTSARPGPEDALQKSHHAKSGFRNPWDSFRDVGPKNAAQMFRRRFNGKGNIPDTTGPTVPVQKPEFLPSRDTPNLRATWLGHACYYVEFPSGLRVLFDPVFEERCGPFNTLGPKRFTKAPCQVKDIPVIDAVVISHNHYDHLSYKTVTEVAKRHPNCHFFVPLGNKPWFASAGIHSVTELDWWDENDITMSPSEGKGVEVEAVGEAASIAADIKARISCLPCQHVSARGPFDKYQTLWSSWAIESGGKKLYFAGDTGYKRVNELPDGEDYDDPKHNFPVCPAFKQVGEFRGPFDLGLIPIGAYAPRFIWSAAHAHPHDSVNIFQDTKCKQALGMHWGTWVLTEEDVLEPPEQLKIALKKHDIPEKGVFDILNIGESREF